MHPTTLLALLIASASAHPNLPPRSVGDSCKTPDGSGTCQKTSDCKGWSNAGPLPGYCPNDPDDVQCCIEKTCSPAGQPGLCQNTYKSCSGTYNGGNFCPGDESVQCCPSGSGSGSEQPAQSSSPSTSSSSSSSNSAAVGQACSPPMLGTCQNIHSTPCSTGYNSGNFCPGDSSIQCCPSHSASSPPASSGPAAPASTCAHPQRDTCSFYPDCLESKYSCGSSGYPLGYGLKYCNAFTSARSQMNAKGVKWISDCMLCLQTALVPFATASPATASCDDLKSTAFGDHPHCYVSTGVCTLGPQDWEVIFETVSPKDLFGGIENLKAVFETAEGCAELYAWFIEQGFIKLLNEVEDAGKDIWDKLTGWCC